MSWRVVHIDMRCHRHCLMLWDCTAAEAAGTAEALFGQALYLATMRVRGVLA